MSGFICIGREMETIFEIQQAIEGAAKELWRGTGVEIEKVVENINQAIDIIANALPDLRNSGIDFPMEFVTAAASDLTDAIDSCDDYKLADNLYYNWKEILEVYQGVIQELDR